MRVSNRVAFVVLSVLGGLGCGLLAVGCASIAHGTKQKVAFTSAPTGASVIVDGQGSDKTPATVALSRKEKHTVKIEMPGYQPFELKLERKVSGWMWGNLAFGGVVGIVIDAVDGAMYKIEPSAVAAALTRGNASVSHDKDVLYVKVVLEADSGLEKIASLDPMP